MNGALGMLGMQSNSADYARMLYEQQKQQHLQQMQGLAGYYEASGNPLTPREAEPNPVLLLLKK